jgi:hypothetical protein
MNTALKTFVFAFAVILFATSCRTGQHLIEQGDYDTAIEHAADRLRGRKHKKERHVVNLETAFNRANQRDLASIEHLKAGNRDDQWAQIHEIALDINRRQRLVAPLLPLTTKDGYTANIKLLDIEGLERDSREKAAEHLYNLSIERINQAENGDRAAARDAHHQLMTIEQRFIPNYRDSYQLRQRARQLGISHILVTMNPQTPQRLPRSFATQLLSTAQYRLGSDEWREFDYSPEPGKVYDFKVVVSVQDIDFAPERVSERSYRDEKEIQDGFEYVLDQRGNVMKDTLGNDIKRPRFVWIAADVLEVYQTKAARVSAALEVYDANRQSLLQTRPLNTEIRFEHYASTFRGDQRALSDQSRCRIGSSPLPFPSNEDMLVQAADNMKHELFRELNCCPVLD